LKISGDLCREATFVSSWLIPHFAGQVVHTKEIRSKNMAADLTLPSLYSRSYLFFNGAHETFGFPQVREGSYICVSI
jgi:hypothetical protein